MRVREAQGRVRNLERAGTTLYNTLTLIEVHTLKHQPQRPAPQPDPTPPPVPIVSFSFYIYTVNSDTLGDQEMFGG